MEEKKEKRVLTVELDDDVKKVSITGLGDDDKVVMMQELNEEDLDEATGGASVHKPEYSYFNTNCRSYDKGGECSSFRITSPQDS
jgi:hypothetical protein